MNDAGYTLTETLAALLVVGMAIGGLSLGLQVLGPLQLSTSRIVSQERQVRASEQSLEKFLALGAPFSSQDPDALKGDGQGFRFVCGQVAPCTAQILSDDKLTQLKISRLGPTPSSSLVTLSGAARFAYRSATTTSDVWPPATPDAQTLRAVVLFQMTSRGEAPSLQAKVWSEERPNCAFDPIAQDCR